MYSGTYLRMYDLCTTVPINETTYTTITNNSIVVDFFVYTYVLIDYSCY